MGAGQGEKITPEVRQVMLEDMENSYDLIRQRYGSEDDTKREFLRSRGIASLPYIEPADRNLMRLATAADVPGILSFVCSAVFVILFVYGIFSGLWWGWLIVPVLLFLLFSLAQTHLRTLTRSMEGR